MSSIAKMTKEIELIIRTVFLFSHLYAMSGVCLIHQGMYWHYKGYNQKNNIVMLNSLQGKISTKFTGSKYEMGHSMTDSSQNKYSQPIE